MITLSLTHENLLRRTVKTYGPAAQWDMVVEELAELIQAIQKRKRYPDNRQTEEDLHKELADAFIMIKQAELMVNASRLQYEIEFKLARLKSNLDKSDTPV